MLNQIQINKSQFTQCDLQQQLVEPTHSDNLVSLTSLTEVGATFAFTRCDISCMLQVVTKNGIVKIDIKFDPGMATA